MQRYIFSVGTYGRCRKTLEEQAKKWERQQRQQQTQSQTQSQTIPAVNQGESVVILPP